MGWFDGFPFKTKAQIEKEQKDFQDKVLPFGLPQRDKAKEVLRQLLTTPKLGDDEILFAYLCAKDAFKQQDEAELGYKEGMHSLRKGTRLALEEKKLVLALILLEEDISGLEEYPTAGMVQQKAQQLL